MTKPMNKPESFIANDYTAVVDADVRHVWHHLTQHKKFETTSPMIFTDSDGLYIWDSDGTK